MEGVCGVILAAGNSKRMGGEVPKGLVHYKGKSLIIRVIENLEKAGIKEIIGVVKEDRTIEKEIGERIKYCYQKESLGTADAVLSCYNYFLDKKRVIVIIPCDMPFVSALTIERAYKRYIDEESDLLVITAITNEPYGYGRIIRDEKAIVDIKEEKDCNNFEKEIKEVNSSIYIVKSGLLFSVLKEIDNNNIQKEFYLTDIVGKCVERNKKVNTYVIEDEKEVLGINTKKDLEIAIENNL